MTRRTESSLEERLEALEQKSKSGFPTWLRDGVTLVSPIALAFIGYFFQQTLQDTRIAIEQNELDIRRIDSAQAILSALFQEDYEEARALHSLFNALMADSKLSTSLAGSIDEYFVAKFDRIARQPNLGQGDVAAMQQTADDASAFGAAGPPAELDVTLHVVLVSLIRDRPGKFARLIPIAEAISADPSVPDAEIWCSSTGIGFLALTVGRHPLDRAWAIGEDVQAKGWDERKGLSPEFYVTRGDHLYRQVWPGPHDPGSDPCL
jgi:hypothetical protein